MRIAATSAPVTGRLDGGAAETGGTLCVVVHETHPPPGPGVATLVTVTP